MYGRIRAAGTAALLAILVAGTVWAAASPTVFIRNKPYKGKVTMLQGKLYLSLAAYAELMDLRLRHEGTCWCLDDKKHATAKCPTADGTNETLFVNGSRLDNALMPSGGEMWIAAQPVTKALGGVYVENKSMGIVDIGLPYVAPVESALRPTASVDVPASTPQVVMVHWFAMW